MRRTVGGAFFENAEEARIRARTRALSAVEVAVFELLSTTRLSQSDLVKSYGIDGATVVVTISDEAGRIDLNRADASLLSAGFAASGAATNDALNIAAAIVDWRDADSTTSPGGAEALDYAAQGYPYGPRNAPLETIGELMQVMGMTDERYACAFDLITVYNGFADVDFDVAQNDVRAVFQWAQANQWQGQDWSIPPPPSGTATIEVVHPDFSGAVLRLTLSVRDASAAEIDFYAIVRLSKTSSAPYELLAFGPAINIPDVTRCGTIFSH